MAKAKNGEAISGARRSEAAVTALRCFLDERAKSGNLHEWRRAKAVLCYIEGERVEDIADDLDVARGSVNRWLRWYETMGVQGLATATPPGATPKLNAQQRRELTALVEAGSIAAGYTSGVWTGPMVGDLIEAKFGVRYHKHNVPRLLHELGFSLQRPRKRLARADLALQETWVRERLPAIKKKPMPAAVSSCMAMKPASGSTAVCIAHGPESENNPTSTRMASARRRMCLVHCRSK